MKNNQDNRIQDEVLNAIKEGKLMMKPRWHFVLMTIMRVLAIVILFFAILYLFSFIGLVTHEKDLFNILDLSPRGVHALMTSIPWIIVYLSIFLLITFYVLVKQYSFVYRKPLVYSFFGLIFFVIFSGFILHIFDINYRFARFGEGERVPVLGPMHKYYRGEMKERKNFDRMEKRMLKQINLENDF